MGTNSNVENLTAVSGSATTCCSISSMAKRLQTVSLAMKALSALQREAAFFRTAARPSKASHSPRRPCAPDLAAGALPEC